MRARYPDKEGYAERDDGVRLSYEVYGDGEPTVLFMPPSWFTHSRSFKAQIPYFARHFRVVVFDGRGNGRSDRPRGAQAYRIDKLVADALAVMDATETESAVTVSKSATTTHNLALCASQPERVTGACLIGPFFPVVGPMPGWMTTSFNERREHYEGDEMYNRHCWRENWRGFVEMWNEKIFPEPHSTKQIEDLTAYALDTDGAPAIASLDASGISEFESLGLMLEGGLTEAMRQAAQSVSCPALVVCGDRDAITPLPWAEALTAAIPDARLEVFAGTGHGPAARYPVRFNLLLREFIDQAVVSLTAGAALA